MSVKNLHSPTHSTCAYCYNSTKLLLMSELTPPDCGRISMCSTQQSNWTPVCPWISHQVLTSGCWGVLFNPWHFCWPLLTDVQLYHRCGCGLCGCTPAGSRPNNRRAAWASLNCSELISPGRCSRFRHSLSEGRDYSSTYGSSYVMHRCAKNSSVMSVCFFTTFTPIQYFLYLLSSIYPGPFQ